MDEPIPSEGRETGDPHPTDPTLVWSNDFTRSHPGQQYRPTGYGAWVRRPALICPDPPAHQPSRPVPTEGSYDLHYDVVMALGADAALRFDENGDPYIVLDGDEDQRWALDVRLLRAR